ncbi:MAG: DUF3806 domain-containing protein [Phycisphaerales bacterium]|nr:DUF3806 domain-containing protein [Phycisphaerales bacterium]
MSNQRKIEPLNPAERDWVTEELGNAQRLVKQFSPVDEGARMTPGVLDRVFKQAYESNPNDSDHGNAVINAVGIAFGQYLVDELGYEWVMVTDEHGCEIAVVALPGTANVLVFPPNLVAKRWVSGTTDFLWYVYQGIEEDLVMFRQERHQ